MKIGVVQFTVDLDPKPNLEKLHGFLKQAKDENCEAVFLPEAFYSMSDGKSITPYLVEKGNDHYLKIQNLAKDYSLYLLGGSAATVNPSGEKAINRNYNFDPQGNELGTYDKIHLFACDLSRHHSKKVLNETDMYVEGKDSLVLEVGPMKIGMGICFDIRFPEMWRDYAVDLGCNVLSSSSAFTVPTGKAHWHTLVRARAIENQCYVIAAAQCGEKTQGVSTFGHSLIVDPWGEIIADAKDDETLLTATLNFDYLKEIRSRLSVLLR